jgi:hypothetical protein
MLLIPNPVSFIDRTQNLQICATYSRPFLLSVGNPDLMSSHPVESGTGTYSLRKVLRRFDVQCLDESVHSFYRLGLRQVDDAFDQPKVWTLEIFEDVSHAFKLYSMRNHCFQVYLLRFYKF